MIDQKRLEEKIWSLPTFPGSVAELYEVTSDPKTTASDVEAIIKRDPALTANVLRIANSARFGLSRRVTGVGHAVTLLGRKLVSNLAVAAACTTILPRRLPGYGLTARTFFRHSVGTAVLAPRLAKEVGVDAPDLTFLAGLLHEIGKLAISTYLADESEALAAVGAAVLDTVEAERALLGTDHTEVGASLARHWQLPEIVAVVAENHHLPQRVERPPLNVLVSLIHVADALAYTLDEGTDRHPADSVIEASALELLRLDRDRLGPIAAEMLGQIEAMADIVSS